MKLELGATMQKIIWEVLLLVTLIAVSSALYFWLKKPPATNTVEYVNIPEIKEVIKIKRVEIPGPERIVTIEKTVIVEKLKLPDWIANNPDEQALATAVIAPYKGKTNAVALLNTKTGVGQIVAKQEPLPLFGFVNDREVGVRAGVDMKGQPETTIYGSWTFVRVGAVHLSVYGDAGSTGTARAQVGVGFRF
jgi:hypothetical protein